MSQVIHFIVLHLGTLKKKWIQDCSENHLACISIIFGVWMPTRVLDVGKEIVRLIEPRTQAINSPLSDS